MKLKLIKEVEILASKFTILYDKNSDGGSFNWANTEIKTGIKSIQKDPSYIFSIISHEIMEVILVSMGARFQSGREQEGYLFNFSHQTFENAIEIHSMALSKFIV